jgi:hypothetical protein
MCKNYNVEFTDTCTCNTKISRWGKGVQKKKKRQREEEATVRLEVSKMLTKGSREDYQ